MKTAKKLLSVLLVLSVIFGTIAVAGSTAFAANPGNTKQQLIPGSSLETSPAFALGETVYGEFNTANTSAFYHFTLPAATTPTIQLNSVNNGIRFTLYNGSMPVTAGPALFTTDYVNGAFTSSTTCPTALNAGVVYTLCITSAGIISHPLTGDEFNFTVTIPGLSNIPSLIISDTKVDVPALTSKQLSITSKAPSDLNIFWESADPSIATVNDSGLVTTRMPATTAITTVDIFAVVYYLGTSHFIRCTVSVIPPDVMLNIDPTVPLKMGKGSKFQLVASPTLATSTSTVITFRSSNPAIAAIDHTGTITAIADGSTTITVTYSYMGYDVVRSFTVYVDSAITSVQGVEVDHNDTTIKVGYTVQLAPIFTPTNPTNKAVTWSSSDPTIATVDANGLVKGVKPGVAKITVTTADSSYTDSVSITVRAAYPNWVEFFLYPIQIIIDLIRLLVASF